MNRIYSLAREWMRMTGYMLEEQTLHSRTVSTGGTLRWLCICWWFILVFIDVVVTRQQDQSLQLGCTNRVFSGMRRHANWSMNHIKSNYLFVSTTGERGRIQSHQSALVSDEQAVSSRTPEIAIGFISHTTLMYTTV